LDHLAISPAIFSPGKAHPNSLDSCRAEFARWIDSEANRRPGRPVGRQGRVGGSWPFPYFIGFPFSGGE